MPELLKLAHLVDQHRVTEMKVGSRRIESSLDAQRLASLKLGNQLRLDEHLISAPLDHRQLLLNRLHGNARTIHYKGRQPYNIAGRLQTSRPAPAGS